LIIENYKPVLQPSIPYTPNKPIDNSVPVFRKFPRADVLIAAIVGEIIAWLIIFILINLGSEIQLPAGLNLKLFLPIAAPILSALGMIIAWVISWKIKVVYQVAKFVLIGGLNTFVDWGFLNLFSDLSKRYANIESFFAAIGNVLSPVLSGFLSIASPAISPLTVAIIGVAVPAAAIISVFVIQKGFSFIIATVNSYFWNRSWTFSRGKAPRESAKKDFFQFLLVSIVGFLLNVGIAAFIFYFGTDKGILADKPETMKNIGAFGGTIIALFWNFLGYKLFVFRR